MSNQDLTGLFKGQFIGMYDKKGTALHEGDKVSFYYKSDLITCKIIYAPEWGMFCLQWSDGYKNKFPMNPERYEKIK